ncbi:MAG: protein translocase subunit SecF, partial [Dietzia sp.]|nr:protein translocase subunit SecF [Dietzia sp.]
MVARHNRDAPGTDVETADTDSVVAGAPRHGFFVRLYTGTGAFEVVGRRKFWYLVSAGIVTVALLAILL